MSQALFDKIESEQFRKEPLDFNVGDTVRVHTKVTEGAKSRTQIFGGVVMGRRGRGLNATFRVRRISYGEGVERRGKGRSRAQGLRPPREAQLPARSNR
jgi:large subunit ribosomal protein L19